MIWLKFLVVWNLFYQAEDAECRMWMLREDCLDDAMIKLTNLLSSKDMCTASNAALVLARYILKWPLKPVYICS